MEKVYFVSFTVASVELGSFKNMTEVKMPRKIRNFSDVLALADVLSTQWREKIGECKVVIDNWIELDEPAPTNKGIEEAPQSEV